MGIAAEQSGIKCQNCKKSIAMLFPNSSCDCVGGIFSSSSNSNLLLKVTTLITPNILACLASTNAVLHQLKISSDECSRSTRSLCQVDGDSACEAAQTNLFSRSTEQGELTLAPRTMHKQHN